ncbi:MAG: hypothetical protein ORN98_01085 [Alphaproteobacteria bacterium]|nr:hypothetical protein [Alphaproteobacteria bacterium]
MTSNFPRFVIAGFMLVIMVTLAGCGVRNDPEPPTPGSKAWPGIYPNQ